jgi:hypothetical protein
MFDKPRVKVGSFVKFKRRDKNPDVRKQLRAWVRVYGPGPFLVNGMIDKDHVSLANPKTREIIYFGSTGYSSIHVGFVRPCQF